MAREFKPKPCVDCGVEFKPTGSCAKRCQGCREAYPAKYLKAYQQKNRERLAVYQKEYRQANYESLREYGRNYGRANRHRLTDYQRGHRRANWETYSEYQRNYRREYAKANPELMRARASQRRQLVKVSMTPEERKKSIEYRKVLAGDPCSYCGQFSEEMHVDHIKPLAKGGTDHWWNLTNSCATCNLRKSDKQLLDFLVVLADERGKDVQRTH